MEKIGCAKIHRSGRQSRQSEPRHLRRERRRPVSPLDRAEQDFYSTADPEPVKNHSIALAASVPTLTFHPRFKPETLLYCPHPRLVDAPQKNYSRRFIYVNLSIYFLPKTHTSKGSSKTYLFTFRARLHMLVSAPLCWEAYIYCASPAFFFFFPPQKNEKCMFLDGMDAFEEQGRWRWWCSSQGTPNRIAVFGR